MLFVAFYDIKLTYSQTANKAIHYFMEVVTTKQIFTFEEGDQC